MITVKIEEVLFPGKNPNMNEVEKYLNDSLEYEYLVKETNDVIISDLSSQVSSAVQHIRKNSRELC